ncbi:MAG: hypothetical protein ACSLEZ_07610 [Thiobacillus sp.]
MLNELLQAANAIPSLPDTLHKSLKTLPKTPAYKILLGEQGDIVGVVPYPDSTQDLRKWQPGANGFSTPIFNSLPLYRVDLDKSTQDAASEAGAGRWAEAFGAIRARSANLSGSWIDPKRDELNEKCRKSLAYVPEQLQALLPGSDPDYAVLRALLERLQRLTPERFFPELARQIEMQLESAYDERLFKLYCAVSDAEAAKSCNLLLDLPDWDEIGDYPVTHERTTELLNALLTRAGSGTASATDTAPDAYGRAATGADEKFADVIVPGLGKVILRAMTKDAPCQYRYGKADANSFLVGKDSRERAKSALEYLTQAGRKGKTWQYRGGSLFLFYPEQELSVLNDSAIADLCGLPDDEDDAFAAAANKAATFEARAERIAAALESKPRESEIPVHLIVLRKPDGHRTKLVAHHTFTMQHFVDSAKAWVAGAKACPPITFSRWGKAKGQRNDIVPEPPFPYQVTSWLNTFWVRGDENQGKFKTFSPEDALTLLLASDGTQTQMARRALRHALAGWAGFLIATGAREHASTASTVLKAGDKRAAALSSLPAILALLLFKSDPDISREHIMASPAFLVGRLLALADSLHYQYCQGVRNGQVPGQLLGNALMATALESPQSALALYAQRILPYQAWARTSKANEKGPETLAKYFLAQLGETCSEICLLDIPDASDANKAQMILGYLAKPTSQPQS